MKQIYKKIYTLSCVLLLSHFALHATHYMGGEIIWECQTNGQYIFRLVLYRDCQGVAITSTTETIDVYNNPTLSSISAKLISKTDISPTCAINGLQLSCGSGGAYEGNGDGAVQEYVFESSPITMTGVPPSTGWIFTWGGCCRNATIDNLQNPDSYGITLRAIMYPYNGLNANPCYDSSPAFAASASTVLCMGYPFTYNHLATDVDLDSLSYSWAEPLDQFNGSYNPPTNPAPIPFKTGYTYTSPLPGTTQNANNVPATINALTGEINYTSYTSGNFVTVVKVEAWRCGQLIAEIYRDIQIVMYDCSGNQPPSVTAPFADPNSGLYTLYADTVQAGDLVTFQLSATDFGTLQNGNAQTMSLAAYGIQFGSSYTSTTSGCPNPPCATLSPPPPYSQTYGLQTTFSWQTDCSHLNYTNGCYNQLNTYTFVVNVYDDYCPAPSMNNVTFTITILGVTVIESPEIRCVSVGSSGDVTLTWDFPVDTDSTFNSYHVYASNQFNGTYVEVDSIFSFYQNTYTLTNSQQTSLLGTTALSDTLYFYIASRSGCDGAIYATASDTTQTMVLDVANVNEVAVLSWNPVYDPILATSSTMYLIYREYPIGTWTLIDSTTSFTYNDTISVCNDTVSYKIEIYDSIGCFSTSTIDGNRFKDNIVPETPELDSVSVNVNNLALLGWEQSASLDVIGYIIYEQINGVWQPIDTASGITTTTYTNFNSDAGTTAEQYRIAAIDSCDNTSPMGGIHNTIFLTPSLDPCTSENTLSWNSYDGWGTSGVAQYNVYASENGVDTILVASVMAGSTTTAVHSSLTQNASYCYFVQAIDTAGLITSSSNDTCIVANVPQQPLFAYHNLVTVISPNQIYASCYIDTAADVSEYKVMRSTGALGPFDLLDYVLVGTDTFIDYLDNSVNTDIQSYYYKFISVDTCGNDGLESNVSRSILLKAYAADQEQNFLYWNDYEGWLGNVKDYNIYRSIDDGAEQLITTLSFVGTTVNKYIDDVSVYFDSEGDFCYRIEAVEGNSNPYSMLDTSYSNYACVEQLPNVYTANAFTPDGDGLNDTYIPLEAYIKTDGYTFSVYDSWGAQLFSTSDPTQGWDGTTNGIASQQGVYLYLVKYKVMGEIYSEKRGTITLIK